MGIERDLTGERDTSEFRHALGLQMKAGDEVDLIVLRELAVKPMRKVGPLQPYIDSLAVRGLVQRTRAGWTPTVAGRLMLEREGKTVH